MPSNIFNVKNRTRKEMYVGVSPLAAADLKARHRASPPPDIKHWDFSRDDIHYEEVERGIPDSQSGLFMRNYSMLTGLPGWKTIIEGLG